MRLKNWRTRLSETIEEARGMPFAWGTNDCAQFAGRCVAAMTGTHPWPALAGTYTDADGARAKMAELGVADMAGFAGLYLPRITNRHGADAPLMALDGDLAVVDQGKYQTLTVCLGPCCIGPGARHLMRVPRTEILSAFRVF